MHVEILRSTALYRAGTTIELDDASAERFIADGTARARRLDMPARNAARDEWAAYASKVNVAHHTDAGRDDIIAAVDSANAA